MAENTLNTRLHILAGQCNWMNRQFIALCLMLVSFPGFAQEFKIFGNVRDVGDGHSLRRVSVTLIAGDSCTIDHTQTDAKGQFLFKDLKADDYVLRFSSLGYLDASVSIMGLSGDYEVKDVGMIATSYELDEVTVSSQTVSQGLDRMTFFPTQRVREASQDAMDVLRLLNLPDIKFDIVNHSFSSLNNGAVQIRIDGVISSQKDLIALQPQDIARIEYVNNPGIIYGEGLSAVILVRTRHNFVGIQNGVRISHALTDPLGNGYAYLNLIKPFDRFSFKLSGNYNRADGNYALSTKTLNYPDGILHLENRGEAYRNRSFSPLAQFDYTHSFTEKSFLNISLKYSFSSTNPSDRKSSAFTDGQSFYSELSSVKDEVHNTSLDVYYSNVFANGSQIDANITGTYIGTDYSDVYSKEYVSADYSNYAYSYLADGRHGSVIGELKYNMPVFTGHYLTFGTRNSYSVTHNDYVIEHRTSPSDMYVFSTYNYAEFSGNLAKLSYSIGGGLSYTARNNDAQGRHYLFFRPKLSLRIPFSKDWSLQYFLGIVSNEPALSLLSNVERPLSEYEVRVGNPALKPYQAYSNRLTLSFMKNHTYCALNGYVQYNANPIFQHISYDDESRMFVYGSNNDGHYLHVQTQLYASQKLFSEKLSIAAYGLMNHYENHAAAYQNKYTAFLYGGSISYNERNWGVAASYQSPVSYLFDEVKTTQNANLQLSGYYKISNIQIALAVNNPFRAHAYSLKEELISELVQSSTMRYANYNNNFVNITISYYFNKGRDKTHRRILHNSDTDSGVLK